VQQGEVILLAGPTGCGKSTLLALLSGIIPHVYPATIHGTIDILGLDPRTIRPNQTAKIVGHLFQNVETQLFTDRVEDEVLLPLEFRAGGMANTYEEAHRMASDTLHMFQLDHIRTHAVDSLSSGLKQRLALASMHLHHGTNTRRVLLLDEPFSFLDPAWARHLRQLLLRFKTAGVSIVVTEHREDILQGVADRIVRMHDTPRPCLNFGQPGPYGSKIVECRNLSFHFGSKVVFQDLSLEIKEGECVTLIGENGAGKTTLCATLAGLRVPCQGHVHIAGRDVLSLAPHERTQTVGLVVQNPDRQLFAPYVGDELPLQDGPRLLQRFGLWELRQHHPKALSYGQKRRLALARILARNPKFLMVDEISVGQDDWSLHNLLEELWSYARAGGCVLVTSHDPRVIGNLPGRIIELHAGKLLQLPQRYYTRP